MRTCCMSDDHKPHLDNCPKLLRWHLRNGIQLQPPNFKQVKRKKKNASKTSR